MNDLLDTLHKLKVIASIQENDKVQTRGGIYITKANLAFQGVLRWISKEDRASNIASIWSIFTKAVILCEGLLSERATITEDASMLTNTQHLTRLRAEMRAAAIGVARLAVTYSEDAHICARISTICEALEDDLTRIDTLFGLTVGHTV